MNFLKMIWPTLGEKSQKIDGKNLSWTKKGPGRKHNHLTKAQVEAKAKQNIFA